MEHLLEVTAAQRDEALDLLEALLVIQRKLGGYTTPEQQATFRAARALLVAAGRSVP